MGIQFTGKGDFTKTHTYLTRLKGKDIFAGLERFGAQGVAALAAATPVDSGETASSWTYEIVRRTGYYSIRWHNTNVQGGKPIAILLQYGHGTKNGGYVQGRDYMNPVILPIFDEIAAEAWKVVTA